MFFFNFCGIIYIYCIFLERGNEGLKGIVVLIWFEIIGNIWGDDVKKYVW